MKLLSPQEVSTAAALLKKGGVVAFPTETVYGLGARVFDTRAIETIFQMKGRPSDNPLICHIATLDQLYLLATDIPEEALKLAAHFWPGPLTLVLKKQPTVPLVLQEVAAPLPFECHAILWPFN
jgi:L-threonylcarbamoyladenylate synthase